MTNQGFNQNNYTFPSAPADGWDDRECPSWLCDFSNHEPYAPVNVSWPNGEPRLVDLKTGQLVPPTVDFEKEAKEAKDKAYIEEIEKRNKKLDANAERAQLEFFAKQVSKMTLQEVGKLFRANDFSCEKQKEIVSTVFISKLPKFSSAMLKRMQETKELESKAQADIRFYTWKKGVTASNTSHTAWGHRRSGGGKGKKEKISIKDTSEEAKLAKAAAKRIRQTLNKEKAKIEMTKRVEAITRIQKQIAKDTIDVDPKKEEELTEEQLKKIEIAKINEENMKKTRTLVVKKIDLTREYFVEKAVKEKDQSNWSVVDKKSKKKDSLAKKIEEAFYTDKADEDFVKEVSKKPMTKAVKRTRFCSSVLKGGKCPHGSKCNFAHTMEELTPKMCAFDKRGGCRCVRKTGSTFSNKGRKVCEYLHEGETKANMCRRLGVKVTETVCKPVTPTCLPVVKMTPIGTRVLKPYSKTRAWGPVV